MNIMHTTHRISKGLINDWEYVKIVEKLSLIATRAQSLFEQFESTSNMATRMIEDLQNKFAKSKIASGKTIEESSVV